MTEATLPVPAKSIKGGWSPLRKMTSWHRHIVIATTVRQEGDAAETETLVRQLTSNIWTTWTDTKALERAWQKGEHSWPTGLKTWEILDWNICLHLWLVRQWTSKCLPNKKYLINQHTFVWANHTFSCSSACSTHKLASADGTGMASMSGGVVS